MKYNILNGTQLEISELGFGCSSYWAKPEFPEEKAIELLEQAFEQGINYFDTGASYANGNAEKRLGKFLKLVDNTKVVISTKAGTSSASLGNAVKDFSVDGVLSSVEGSIERLGRNWIDILFLHSPKVQDLSDELVGALEGLITTGKVKYIGVHSSDKSVVDFALKYDVFSIFLSDYNVMRCDFEPTIMKINSKGKGFIAATPLAQMLFTNKVFIPKNLKDIWYLARALKNRRKQLFNGFKLRFINTYKSFTAEEIALNFVLDNECVSAAVFGTTQKKNLNKNIIALKSNVPKSIFEKIKSTKLPYKEC